jgi:hypothetical protein
LLLSTLPLPYFVLFFSLPNFLLFPCFPSPACHSPTFLPPSLFLFVETSGLAFQGSPFYTFISLVFSHWSLVLADSPLFCFLLAHSSSILPPFSPPFSSLPSPHPCPCLALRCLAQTCCCSPTTPTTTPLCLRERCPWPPSMTLRNSWPLT